MGVPRARKLKLFSDMAIWPAAILFRAKLACPTKKARRAQIWMSGHLAASAFLARKKHVGNSARMMTGTNF